MTLNSFTAEGGTNGVAVASTDTGSGDAPTTVSPGTGGSITYASAAAQKGTLGLSFAAAASASCYIDWLSVPGAVNTGFALRGYFYVPVRSSANQPLISLRSSSGSTGILSVLLLGTATNPNPSCLRVTCDLNASSTMTEMTAPLSAATWYRIEIQGSNASSTTGTLNIQIYPDDSATPITNGTVALTAQNYFSTSAIGAIRWGRPGAIGSAHTVYADDLAFQTATTTAIGASSATQVSSGSAALSGSGTLGVTGRPNWAGSAALSGSGGLAASGTPTPAAVVGLTGSGTLTASGSAPIVAGSAGLSGSGTLTATGAALALTGSAALSGAGTLTASGSTVVATVGSGSADFSGIGQLTATGNGRQLFWTLHTPTTEVYYRLAGRGLVGSYTQALSIYRTGGQWFTKLSPSAEDLAGADRYYQGGYRYELTDAEAAELASAGLGHYLDLPDATVGLALVGSAFIS